jgi:DNA-binding NarL/FixJ family response regulator
MNKERIKIIIADDHPIFRKGLRQAIETDHELEIVGEAQDGVEALELIEVLKPAAIVLDIEMPRKTGLEVARDIQKRNLPVEIIFLTMYKDEDMFNEAMSLGVKGYVLKECAVSDITTSVKTVVGGHHFISPAISELLVNRNDRARVLVRRKPRMEDLTVTEKKVLRFIAENKTSKEIAVTLHVSYRTIENHRSNICNKLDIHGSHSLLKFAIEHKSFL